MKKNTSWKFTDESSVTFQSSVSGAGEFGQNLRNWNFFVLYVLCAEMCYFPLPNSYVHMFGNYFSFFVFFRFVSFQTNVKTMDNLKLFCSWVLLMTQPLRLLGNNSGKLIYFFLFFHSLLRLKIQFNQNRYYFRNGFFALSRHP